MWPNPQETADLVTFTDFVQDLREKKVVVSTDKNIDSIIRLKTDKILTKLYDYPINNSLDVRFEDMAWSLFYHKKYFWNKVNLTHPYCVLHSFSIKNIFYNKMDLRFFPFHETVWIFLTPFKIILMSLTTSLIFLIGNYSFIFFLLLHGNFVKFAETFLHEI